MIHECLFFSNWHYSCYVICGMSETIIKLPIDKFWYLKVKEWPPSKYKIPKILKEKIKNEKANI